MKGSENLILIVVLVAAFYFLMVVPQRRQQKKRKDMMNQLGVGAEVVSAGGIHGEVTEVMDDTVMLEIAPDVEITIERRSIVRVLEAGALLEDDEDEEDQYDEDEYDEEDEEESDVTEESNEALPEGGSRREEVATEENEEDGQTPRN